MADGTYVQKKVMYLDFRRCRVLQAFKLFLARSGLPAAKLRHAVWICLDATYSTRSPLNSGGTTPFCSAFRAEVTKMFCFIGSILLHVLFVASV